MTNTSQSGPALDWSARAMDLALSNAAI